MPLTVEQLAARLKDSVGDPTIRIVTLPKKRQILCRETDEDLVITLTRHYCATEPGYEVMGLN
jgi:hypothetical protein